MDAQNAQSTPGLGSGGGGAGAIGAIPPTPVHTGKLQLFMSRTFRHYIGTQSIDYTKTFNQGWSDIPYQWIAASIKPRDWQWINIASKRWRVLTFGFNMSNIMPLVNEKVTVGGAVATSIAFNMAPYLETYIDKGYQLPYDGSLYTPVELLPNKQFSQNSGNQVTAQLRKIETDKDELHQQQTVNTALNALNKYRPDMDLMNSSEWATVAPGQEFSFEHTVPPEDLVWRHAVMPLWVNNWGKNDADGASANGMSRWDGFINDTTHDETYNNTHILNNLSHNPVKPAPNCIVRPVTVHDTEGVLLPIVFQVLIKYHCWIELDLNEIANKPIVNRNFTGTPTPLQVYNPFFEIGGQGVRNNRCQWSGGSAAGMYLAGPYPEGGVI